MKKLAKFGIPVLLLLLLRLLWGNRDMLPGWEPPRELPRCCQRQIQQELQDAASLLEGSPAEIDAREALLAQAGLSVLDTDAVYPAYLANPETLRVFWEEVCAGQDATLSLLRLPEAGTLRHIFFLHEEGETLFFTTDVRLAEGEPSVTDCAVLPVYDMELTDWGQFYYRVYPAGDPHYVDYGQIRLSPADETLYDLNRTCILPVGYQMVNLFLVDWQEGDWGTLSFHDTLESLYTRNTGAPLNWEGYPRDDHRSRVRVPAAVFEDAILPYFQISLAEFRSLCQYDEATDSYPWQAVHGDDLTTWHYPMCEPEVVSATENSDGTVTLEVQVHSPELKTDRLFCHELTVRLLENGCYQYAANRVTYVSDQGLPPNMARFDLRE